MDFNEPLDTRLSFLTSLPGETKYVIRKDDLNLIERLAPVAASLGISYSLPTQSGEASALCGLLLSIVLIARRLWTKGVIVQDDDYFLLKKLKDLGPVSLPDLTKELNGLSISSSPKWTEAKVLSRLRQLASQRTRDESVIAIVQESSGEWSTNA